MTDEEILETKKLIKALEDALAAGALEVSYNGKKTTFGSAGDLIRRISYFKNKLPSEGKVQVAGFQNEHN